MSFLRASVALCAAATLTLAACGDASSDPETDDPGGAPGDSATGFPITITHAFGETVIPEAPERVASVAWANHEVALALGVVPVGMAEVSWGDDDGDGVLPWVEDALSELGADTPVLFDETDGIDFEAVSDTNPDVILAAYSGLSQDEYETLSKIAPVVAYPETAWSTTMHEMIDLNSQALGLAEEGQQLIADLDEQIAEATARFPQLEGKAGVFTWVDATDLSQIGFYTTHDPRSGFLEDLGLVTPAVVADASTGSTSFFETVSAENSDAFDDVDLFITYGPTDGSVLALVQADPLLSKIPALADGALVVLEDDTPLAASANPSPLSIGWGLEDYLELLADAVDASTAE